MTQGSNETQKFKVGDRVRLVRSADTALQPGDEGTVIGCSVRGPDVCKVTTHSGVWHIFADNLELVRPAGAKDDTGKLRHDLVPTALLSAVASVLTYGAFERPRDDGSKGYGKNNWQGVEDAKARYYAALQRHLIAWRRDPKSKDESGRSHLAHAATNLAFLLSFDEGHDPVL